MKPRFLFVCEAVAAHEQLSVQEQHSNFLKSLETQLEKQHQEQLAEQKKSIANLEKKIFEKLESHLKGILSGHNISLSSRPGEVDGQNMPN